MDYLAFESFSLGKAFNLLKDYFSNLSPTDLERVWHACTVRIGLQKQ